MSVRWRGSSVGPARGAGTSEILSRTRDLGEGFLDGYPEAVVLAHPQVAEQAVAEVFQFCLDETFFSWHLNLSVRKSCEEFSKGSCAANMPNSGIARVGWESFNRGEAHRVIARLATGGRECQARSTDPCVVPAEDWNALGLKPFRRPRPPWPGRRGRTPDRLTSPRRAATAEGRHNSVAMVAAFRRRDAVYWSYIARPAPRSRSNRSDAAGDGGSQGSGESCPNLTRHASPLRNGSPSGGFPRIARCIGANRGRPPKRPPPVGSCGSEALPRIQRFATPPAAAGGTRSNRTRLRNPGRSLSTYSSPCTSAPIAVGWVGKLPITADS